MRSENRPHWPQSAVIQLAMLVPVLVGCGRASQTSFAPSAAQRELQSRAAAESPNLAPEFNTEEYASIVENSFINALSNPQSTFAIDVDTASYSNVRRMIQAGSLPPAGAVRIEELVNYFNYSYPEPTGEHPFSVSTQIASCPWKSDHRLFRVGLKGKSIDQHQRPPCNLVFLLDVSGSMMAQNKLPLVKSAMGLLVSKLQSRDRVAIAVYAGASGLVLDSTSMKDSTAILDAIERLAAGGSTNGGQGIHLAYQVAQQNFISGGINRVILCTDGDFNVGATSDSELVELIQEKAASNVFLTVLGFGSGNLKDSKMEQLADKGNGSYAYIDSLLEARKVLVEQIGGTLLTIAKDVKIQIDFNPQHVQAYRLLGYENRRLENRDFRDDTKDAGEIGAGHTVTAFYEIVPAGRHLEIVQTDEGLGQERPSEFVDVKLSTHSDAGTMLTVNLRYKQPNATESSEFQVRLAADSTVEEPSPDFQFASAVVAYGMLLRQSENAGKSNWDWVVQTAQANTGGDPSGLRAEFVQLAKTARRISHDTLARSVPRP